MNILASLFVAKPMNVLAVALVFFACYLRLRFHVFGNDRQSSPVLVAAAVWLLYAAWEWLAMLQDTGSEYPCRPSRDMADDGNPVSVGAISCAAIEVLDFRCHIEKSRRS